MFKNIQYNYKRRKTILFHKSWHSTCANHLAAKYTLPQYDDYQVLQERTLNRNEQNHEY